MDFFEMVNHFFNREREVIQNPLAPEPVEVPPHQEQREALRSAIQTLILEQVREHCEKGKGRLSVHFPEMAERYSSAAENIMSRDLEISAEMVRRRVAPKSIRLPYGEKGLDGEFGSLKNLRSGRRIERRQSR